MKSGGFPVFIDEWNFDIGLGVAPDQGGDTLLVKPSLNGFGALVKDPRVGVGIPD